MTTNGPPVSTITSMVRHVSRLGNEFYMAADLAVVVMRRDVADGCGANNLWISGEPSRDSSGSRTPGANLGEERRALVVDQECSATSSAHFRPKLLRVASYLLGRAKAEQWPMLLGKAALGTGQRCARRTWIHDHGVEAVPDRRQSRTRCRVQQKFLGGSVAVRPWLGSV